MRKAHVYIDPSPPKRVVANYRQLMHELDYSLGGSWHFTVLPVEVYSSYDQSVFSHCHRYTLFTRWSIGLSLFTGWSAVLSFIVLILLRQPDNHSIFAYWMIHRPLFCPSYIHQTAIQSSLADTRSSSLDDPPLFAIPRSTLYHLTRYPTVWISHSYQ